MKKIISVIALVALMLSFTTMFAFAWENGVDYFIRGDVTQNGKIDSRDYLLVKRAYFGTITLTDAQMAAADVNQNGKIDARDYLLLKRVYFGTTKFEVATYPDELEGYLYEYGSIDGRYQDGELDMTLLDAKWENGQLIATVALINATEDNITNLELTHLTIIDSEGNVIVDAIIDGEPVDVAAMTYESQIVTIYPAGVLYPYADLSSGIVLSDIKWDE